MVSGVCSRSRPLLQWAQFSTPYEAAMIGTNVDQFRILQAMGSSPIADSYLAVHSQTGAKFVLKALKPSAMAQESFKKALLTETVQLIKLSHPNVVTPSNLLEVGGRLFLVFEHVEGQTIAEMLRTQKERLAVDGVLRIFKDLLRGFGYAHTEGLVHNLLHPGSILVTPDGEARILGFGWTYQREKERQTSEQERLYYAHYFAPERFNNPDTRDVRTNLYSLGTLLYQILLGRPPFTANSLFELEMAHVQNPVENPRTYRPDLPKGLSTTINKALAKRPEDRFQTALEFYKEIEKVESMRRSELFQEDFVKGFGEIDALEGTGVFKEPGDSSASFKIEDAFSESSMDFNFDLPSEAEPADRDNQETVRDLNFSMDAVASHIPATPAKPAPAKAEGPSAATDFSFEADFGSMEWGASEPPAEPMQKAATPAPAPSAGLDEMGNFDFGDFSSDVKGVDLDASMSGYHAPSVTDPSFHKPDEFSFDVENDPAALHKPAAAPGKTSSLQTEDGAFSFDLDVAPEPSRANDQEDFSQEEQEAAPMVRRNRDGLKSSLEAAERKQAAASPPIRVRRVMEPKILIFTGALGLVAVALLGLWLYSGMQKKGQRKALQSIQVLRVERKYEEALAALETRIAGASGKFKRDLGDLRNQVEKEKLELEVQVAALLDRARQQEMSGQVFHDGQNDSVASYRKVLELMPENAQAQAAMQDILKNQLAEVETHLAAGKSLEALRQLKSLTAAFPDDAALSERAGALREKLVAENASTLKMEINQLFQKDQLEKIPPLFLELKEIEPQSDFVTEMNRMLVSAYLRKGEEARARTDFENAYSYFQTALEIDPSQNQLKKDLEELKSETQRVRIERNQTLLEEAQSARDWPGMFKHATELNRLDPGNMSAHNALIQTNDHVQATFMDAERKRELGQYRQAADLYKEIFTINSDPQAEELMRKYAQWAPPPGMAFVPGGAFTMGSYFEPDARPGREVTLPAFFIGATEVTNAQFQKFIEARPEWAPGKIKAEYHDGNYLKGWSGARHPADEGDFPVRNVCWFAAVAYAEFAGKRLPTEAEWEKAAGGGNMGKKYWWGDTADAKMAVYEFYPAKQPARAGSFPANAYAIHEILGNVAEWVLDAYDPAFYPKAPSASPVNEGPGLKVVRGGHFKSRSRDLAVYRRDKRDPRTCDPTIGFRVAQSTRGD
jgi:formylglycine-generating enzyme required for sulfatase activity/serine/threonine protein kinase